VDNRRDARGFYENPPLKVLPSNSTDLLRWPEPDSDRCRHRDLRTRSAWTILTDKAGSATERPSDRPGFIEGQVKTSSEASVAIRTKLVTFEE
jgi:hypothetical protein